MVYDIVYVCNSTNNKNIRGNELKILRKLEDQLCFEFGESESNVKRRFYRNLDELNSDFEEVQKIKEKLEKEATEEALMEDKTEHNTGYAEVIEEPVEEKKPEVFKKTKNKGGKRNIF